ncbi:DUF262 domain-containing protein [Morganella morganii]|uniref:DUF262 domain-containing protein n=1 Tax=Morganella morganii TaxID=582 RepID=UPI00237E17C9|nr:DUF262 domain-containing protein [Morganella morganii]HEO9688711.1 DUF262 domain-containing protein [Morganella morganii subsp. morganii]EKQ1115363.1 DUF262 domain-containing protein [Morganella morganii]MBS5193170.1 DUF262 domain-containing protein [Morganella morganii]MDE2537915.1 DUF262 domain-containing protein [Morganella morganii]HCL5896477.1 DUF262 domain-containing protein [Morganella morganii]
MIKSVFNYPVSTLLDIEAGVVYAIPRYQREYTWGKWQWDALFEDLLENDLNYYLGSIICINQSTDTLALQQLELVDGQQRMTTLSLLLAAIYASYNQLGIKLEMEQQIELYNLKHKLVLKKNVDQPRLVPQVQNANQQDYLAVLKEAGILKEAEWVSNAGNRRVFRTYRHFLMRIEQYVRESETPLQALNALLDKVNASTLVKIEVASHSDAYTLFESLNNRGVPLTAIDLMKNKLLAKIEQIEPGSINKSFISWTKVMEALGDDYGVQERFFRQYYNAFKPELKGIVNVPVATKSNLIQIFEKLIAHDPHQFLQMMRSHSNWYAQIVGNCEVRDEPELTKLLKSLDRIQGAPSYLLLLMLFARRQNLALSIEHIEKVVTLLLNFFVRRNTTDVPATRDLNRIFMELNEILRSCHGEQVVSAIANTLGSVSTSDEHFRQALSGALYEENSWVCRFILCALEESMMTKESQVDLWAVEGKQYVWTIEHVFPQGINIPDSWVDMIADGDKTLAEQYRQSHVHKLGNLTISGYNSSLGNKCFLEKRDRTTRDKRPVGYNNGLYLNQELAVTETWSIAQIEQRTAAMVDKVLTLFSLPGVVGR